MHLSVLVWIGGENNAKTLSSVDENILPRFWRDESGDLCRRYNVDRAGVRVAPGRTVQRSF